MKPLCHLNGRILPLEEARLSPLDRGFLFGDALYEVIKVRNGALFELDAHLHRLNSGFESTGIGKPRGLHASCQVLVETAELEMGYLYIQVSRGVAPRSHLPPQGLKPTVFILPGEFEFLPPAGKEMRAVTRADRRWGNCDIKTTSLLGTVLGKIDAEQQAADEVLFFGERGEIREGGQTNFFVRRNGVIETHPAGRRILPGVTRQLLLRFAHETGIEVMERAPLLGQRSEWREAFICGTLSGVQPIVKIDGTAVGDGAVGDFTRLLASANELYELQWLDGLGIDAETAAAPHPA